MQSVMMDWVHNPVSQARQDKTNKWNPLERERERERGEDSKRRGNRYQVVKLHVEPAGKDGPGQEAVWLHEG